MGYAPKDKIQTASDWLLNELNMKTQSVTANFMKQESLNRSGSFTDSMNPDLSR